MNRMMFVHAMLLVCSALATYAQPPSPLSYYPHAAGNVWQYRDAIDNRILYTRYNDTLWTDSVGNIFIRGRNIPGQNHFVRIDTGNNVYNLMFQPNYPRYRLAADSGESWVAGRGIISPDDTARVTVSDVYQGLVFGALTTIKVFTFRIVFPPPQPPTWLGDEHLASGFGLVYSFIEGGGTYYLAGAIIDSVQWGTIVGAEEHPSVPAAFKLHQNHPNPFNPRTTITYDLDSSSHVNLTIFDMLGRRVSILVEEDQQAGRHTVTFDGTSVSSGVLFYRLEARGLVQTKSMVMLK